MFETRSERRPRDTRAFRRLRVSRAPVRFALALARLAPKDNACSAGYFLDFFFHMKSGPDCFHTMGNECFRMFFTSWLLVCT